MVVCYSSLRRPSRFNAIKAAVGDRCHIEKAKGNDIQNKEYCSKEGQFTEWGTPVGQGRRSDLLEIVQLVQSGETSMERIARECPVQVIKYYKGIEAYIRLTRPIPERDFKTEVRFYYGRPGSGKSRRAISQRLKLLEDEYTTSLAEIGGMDTNSMSASSSMTFMDG